MTISIIAAIAENNVIGKDNDLIWHISEDLKRFKKLTSGHTIIMGRKTYESLPFKPLPNRKNIILSGKTDLKFKGAIVVTGIEDALKKCDGEEEIFICGGATIYKYFLPVSDKMYITKVYKEFEGDTFFPEINLDEWELIDKKDKEGENKKTGEIVKFSFLTYKRKL